MAEIGLIAVAFMAFFVVEAFGMAHGIIISVSRNVCRMDLNELRLLRMEYLQRTALEQQARAALNVQGKCYIQLASHGNYLVNREN